MLLQLLHRLSIGGFNGNVEDQSHHEMLKELMCVLGEEILRKGKVINVGLHCEVYKVHKKCKYRPFP